MSISSCYDDISRYNELKVKLQNVISCLNASIGDISAVPNTIASVYSIDDEISPIVNKFTDLSNDIVNTSNYISTVILPAIDIAIYNKKVDIYNMEIAQNSN